MSKSEKRIPKPGKVGRSLEEVMVMRKLLNASDPSSWPEGKAQTPLPSLSSSLPGNLQQRGALSGNLHFSGESFGGPNAGAGVGTVDSDAMIKSLQEHCRSLQKKVKVLERNLEGTVVTMQRELQETRKAANEKLDAQQKALVRNMDEAYEAKAKLVQMVRQSQDLAAAVAAAGPSGSVAMAEIIRGVASTAPAPVTQSESSRPKTPLELAEKNREERRRKLEAMTKGSAAAAAKPSTIQSINNHMAELDMKVLHLKELFRHGDPLVERRESATRIVAAVRGFLQRRRYAYFRKGRREWRWLRCKQVLWLLDLRMAAKKAVTQRLEQHIMFKSMRTMMSVFARWVLCAKQSRPVRQEMHRRAFEMGKTKDLELLKVVFAAFKLVTVGGKSTKHANEARRKMIESIRTELSDALKARGELGVVPIEDIERMLYRRVLQEVIERKRLLMLRNLWANGLAKNLRMARANMKLALQQWSKVRAGRCFYAWSEWVYMVGAGLDRKRWSAPRKYEVRYNQKRIDGFAKLRLKRHVFGPWKEFFKIQWLVRKGYQRQIARFVRDNFKAWRARAKVTRALRIAAVDNWKGYARLLLMNPFLAWAGHVRGIKNQQQEQQRLVNSYLRWKWRQRVNTIVKRWRHQALYGRIDGLYSRQMLIASLNEQKIMSSGLEKILAAQTVEMDELREITEREISKRKGLEERLKDATAEIHKYKMFFHHSEQELRRNEAMVESMAALNPRQVEHIKKMQPDFRFKLRKVHLPIGEGEESMAEDMMGGGGGGGGGSLSPEGGSSLGGGLADDVALAGGETGGGGGGGGGDRRGDGTPGGSPEQRAASAGMGGAQASRPATANSPDGATAGASFEQRPTSGGGGLGMLAVSSIGLGGPWLDGGAPMNNGNRGGWGVPLLSNEDQLLPDRARWLARRFSERPPKPIAVPTLRPSKEIRTVNVVEVNGHASKAIK